MALAVTYGLVCVALLRAGAAMGGPRAMVNLQSFAAVIFIVGVFLISRKSGVSSGDKRRLSILWLGVIPLPFLITLQAPFLFDSYVHVFRASSEDWQEAFRTFYVHPASGDFFFRPLGYLDYRWESGWAHVLPATWRLNGIVWHLLSAFLLYALSKNLGLTRLASMLAALVFGLHGSGPEVVSWTAARFDEMATCFTLASLIFVCRYVASGRNYMLMLAMCLCALISKESAICLPFLAVCILFFQQRNSDRPRLNRQGLNQRGLNQQEMNALAGLLATTAVVMIYRTWVLSGIGGYRDATGNATALHISFLHLFELIFFRMWAVLFFPVNWSAAVEWWLGIAIVMLFAGGIILLISASPERRRLLSALAFCVLALLPAYHLALLDSTILGSRVYHLSLVGFALVIATICDGVEKWPRAVAATFCIVVFEATALTHNLLIWRDTAEVAARVCNSIPAMIPVKGTPVSFTGLPQSLNGAYLLSNGFSECVLLNTGQQLKVVPTAQAQKHFIWDAKSLTVVPLQ